jgi:predicted O-methyltransferase YrrM
MITQEVVIDTCSRYHAGQSPREMTWFCNAAEEINPKVIVEIGRYAGGSLKLLSLLAKSEDCLIISIDLTSELWDKNGWDISSNICPIHLLNGDTHSVYTKEKLKRMLGGKLIDVLFIDGDHSFEGTKMDHEMYGELVRPGGIIGFHDITMKRLASDKVDSLKCGEYWDTIPDPKFSCVEQPDPPHYGIGYIIKGD